MLIIQLHCYPCVTITQNTIPLTIICTLLYTTNDISVPNSYSSKHINTVVIFPYVHIRKKQPGTPGASTHYSWSVDIRLVIFLKLI